MPSISHIKPTYAFFFAGATPLGLGLALEYASKLTITSRIAGVYVALNVPDGPTVYIYNFDMSEPSANDLENQYDSTEELIVDHDFKWLYALLRPGSGTLYEWGGGTLPEPYWHRDGTAETRGIRVSTCLGARMSV